MSSDPAIQVTEAIIDSWADDMKGPVALHLKQVLLPVEGPGSRHDLPAGLARPAIRP